MDFVLSVLPVEQFESVRLHQIDGQDGINHYSSVSYKGVPPSYKLVYEFINHIVKYRYINHKP